MPNYLLHPPSFVAHPSRRRHRRRTGLSLVELLISLAITSMLLTAVAASYSAASNAVTANDEFFRATQAGRVSLSQVLSAVRQCTWCQVGTDAEHNAAEALINTANPVSSVTANPILQVLTPDNPNTDDLRFTYWLNRHLTFSYDAAARKLRLLTDDDTTDPDYSLASNVESCTFTSDIEENAQNKQKRVVRVSVTIVVKVGENQIRLSGSAVPRRVMIYQ